MAVRFRFGEFELDTLTGELVSASGSDRLPPKVLGVLHALLEHHDRVVSLVELRERVWPDVSVGFDSVHKAIAGARRALGDASALIETVPRRGYRFTGELRATTPTSSASHAGSLVGRSREILMLEQRLREAHEGRPQVSVLIGAAGIGKTTLARAFSGYAEANGALTAVGRAFEGGGALPYRPWLQIFRSLDRKLGPGRLKDAFGPGARHVSAALPELSDALGCSRERDPEQPDDAARDPWVHARFFDAVGECLARLSEQRPLVLVLDDLHRADRDSIRLMAYIVHQVPEGSILLIGATRHTPPSNTAVAEGIDRILRDRPEACIEVGGFGADEVTLMVESHGRADESLDALELADLSGGNPLILSQWLARSGDPEELAAISSRGLQATVERLLEDASPATRAWIDVAAVFGREFPHAIVAASLDLTPADAEAALEEALRIGVIDREPEKRDWHRFTHGLIPELIVDGLGDGARTRAHARLTHALELANDDAADDSRLTMLAHHALSSGSAIDATETVRHALGAAQSARRRLAHDVALDFFTRAADRLIGEPGLDLLRAECQINQGELLLVLGRLPEARATLAAAAESALAQRHVVLSLAAVLSMSRIGETGNVDLEQRDRLRRTLELTGPTTDVGARAHLLSALGKSYYFDDRPRALELTAEAERLARTVSHRPGLAYVLNNRRFVTESPDNHDECRALTAEFEQIADGHGDPFIHAGAAEAGIRVAIEAGERFSLDRFMGAEQQLARRHDVSALHCAVRVHAAMLALLEGRFTEGLTLAEDARETGLHFQPDAARQWYAVQRMIYELEVGDPGTLLEELADLTKSFPMISTWPAVLALGQAHGHERNAALALLRRLAADRFETIPRDMNLPITLGVLARTAHEVGDAASAAILFDLLSALPNRCICIGSGAGSEGSVARHVGLCAETMGDFAAAEQAYAQGIEIDEALGARPFAATGRLGLARSILERDPDDATGAAEVALRLATEEAAALGMNRLAAACEDVRSPRRAVG